MDRIVYTITDSGKHTHNLMPEGPSHNTIKNINIFKIGKEIKEQSKLTGTRYFFLIGIFYVVPDGLYLPSMYSNP